MATVDVALLLGGSALVAVSCRRAVPLLVLERIGGLAMVAGLGLLGASLSHVVA